jgi:polysaccharide export outer membrane protein
VLDVGDMASAIMVKPYDVIYVPRTYIADVNLFMNQYFSVAQQVSSFLVNLSAIRSGNATVSSQ